MIRLVCWLFGHRWFFLFGSLGKAAGLAHLHPMAGEDHFCTRCGTYWDDAEPGDRAKFYAGMRPDWGPQ